MRVGTKSLLFGVHAIWFHPLVVSLAWRRRYKRWPNFYEAIAIFFHDVGYVFKNDLDGEEGKLHPVLGANITYSIVEFLERCRGQNVGHAAAVAMKYFWLVLGHSRSMSKIAGIETSALCPPDKESILFEPAWWYLLRATLSGEIREYKAVAIRAGKISPFATNREWFDYFKGRVAARAV